MLNAVNTFLSETLPMSDTPSNATDNAFIKLMMGLSPTKNPPKPPFGLMLNVPWPCEE